MWDVHKRDIEMLKLLATQEKKMVAAHYGLTLRGLDSWIFRIRERRREYQRYINNILNYEKIHGSRLKKILLSSKLPEREDDDKVENYIKSLKPKTEDWEEYP